MNKIILTLIPGQREERTSQFSLDYNWSSSVLLVHKVHEKDTQEIDLSNEKHGYYH